MSIVSRQLHVFSSYQVHWHGSAVPVLAKHHPTTEKQKKGNDEIVCKKVRGWSVATIHMNCTVVSRFDLFHSFLASQLVAMKTLLFRGAE